MRTHGLSSFLVLSLLACPSDDAADTDNADATSQSTGSGSEQSCTPGTDGCPCRDDDTCEPLLICVQGTCEIDQESENGPSTLSTAGSETTDATTETTGGATDTTDGTSATSDTGTQSCSSSEECPRGEVCTAPAASPGVPAEPFTCGSTCAGLGPDAAVCTDDASCCGAFCDQGSCLAP